MISNNITDRHKNLSNSILSPLGVEEPYTCIDIEEQVNRLVKLYHDVRKKESALDDRLILYNLLDHYYFKNDYLIRGLWVTEKFKDYYVATKEYFAQIPNIQNQLNQNLAYKTVIRNLLIIASNICNSESQIDLNSIDINLKTVGYLCKYHIKELLNADRDVSLSEANRIAAFVKHKGGFPIQCIDYVEDPVKKKQLKYIIKGVPLIEQKAEIQLYDCNFAHLFYAVFLTALLEKVEATTNGKF